MSGFYTQKQWDELELSRSKILNAKICKFGPTSTAPIFGLDELKFYLEEIISKRIDPLSGPSGLLEVAKMRFNEAVGEWEHYKRTQRLPKDKKPKGRYAENIYKWRAARKRYEAEARYINSILAKEAKVEDSKLEKLQKKYAWKGNCKNDVTGVVRCDFREVKNGKFTDTGESLDKYLIEVKKRKREHALAQAKVLREEQAQIERNRLGEIQSRKIAVDEQLKKIRRRRPQAPPA